MDLFGFENDQMSLFEDNKELVLPPHQFADVETTGFSTKGGYVIEVAARRDDGESFDSLICPPMFITPEITAVTGITEDMISMAPKAEEVFPKFFDFIGTRVLIAHNAPFDKKFLEAEAQRLGIPYSPDFIDTVSIARKLLFDIPVYPNEKSRNTLGNLCKHFGIVNTTAHRALSDVDAMAELFYKHLWPLCVEHNFNPINFTVARGGKRKAS